MLGAVLLREARVAVPAAWSEATVRAAVATVNHSDDRRGRLGGGQAIDSGGAQDHVAPKAHIGVSHSPGCRPDRLGGVGRPGLAQEEAFAEVGREAESCSATEGRGRRSAARTESARYTRQGRVSRPGARAGRAARPRCEAVPDAGVGLSCMQPYPSPEYATTGPDGRFQFAVTGKRNIADQTDTVVAAAAPNYGVGWVEVPPDGQRDDLTLRLVDDDVPITGQIIDLEGKPVPGATLQRDADQRGTRGRPRPLARSRQGQERASAPSSSSEYLPRFTIAPCPEGHDRCRGPLPAHRHRPQPPRRGATRRADHRQRASAYPDAAGRDDRRGRIRVSGHDEPRSPPTTGPTSGTRPRRPSRSSAWSATRTRRSRWPGSRSAATRWPSAPQFVGFDIVRTTTDAQGRYRLTGMPKGEGNQIMAVPGSDQPYLLAHKDVPDSPGLDPVTVDFELKRGIWIEGKITDKVTGKPLQGTVEYFALSSNPNLRDYPGFDGAICHSTMASRRKRTDPTGSPACRGPAWSPCVAWTITSGPPIGTTSTGSRRLTSRTAPVRISHPINYTATRPDRPAQGRRFGEAGRDARPGLDVHGHGARAGRPAPGRGGLRA